MAQSNIGKILKLIESVKNGENLRNSDYKQLADTLSRQTDFDKLYKSINRQSNIAKLQKSVNRDKDVAKIKNIFEGEKNKRKYFEARENALKYQQQYADWGVDYDLPQIPKNITDKSINRINKYTDRNFINRKIRRDDTATRFQRAEMVINTYRREIQVLSPKPHDILDNAIQDGINLVSDKSPLNIDPYEYGVINVGETLIKSFPNGLSKAYYDLRPQYGGGAGGSNDTAYAIAQRFLDDLSKYAKISKKDVEDWLDTENVNNFDEDDYWQ